MGDSRELVEGLLSLLRNEELIGCIEKTDNEIKIQKKFDLHGWRLSNQGFLSSKNKVDLEVGGRASLEETLNRLAGSAEDPALAIGTVKELLESIAKFVLEERGVMKGEKLPYPQLLTMAFEYLNLKPNTVDENVAGAKYIKSIYQGAIQIAINTNELRNLQGTGHGRTLPTGVSPSAAQFVVR